MPRTLLLICLVLLLAACTTSVMPTTQTPTVAPRPTTPPPPVSPVSTPPPATPAREPATVVAVTDGDTIRVRFGDGRIEPVRYIGIDTPETVDPRATVECFGAEASARNAALVQGRTVQLEQDVSERDQYGRLLRYVWVTGDDGIVRFANQELVTWGFAAATSYPPDVRYQQIFTEAQEAAQRERRGLWASCPSAHAPLTAPPAPTVRSVIPTPLPSSRPTSRPTAAPRGNCDPSYPSVCIPPAPPDLDCGDIPHRRFAVLPPDPHRFDGDHDGVGCE